MADNISFILSECLQAIERGELTLDQCLARHPARRDELAALLSTAQTLRAASQPQRPRRPHRNPAPHTGRRQPLAGRSRSRLAAATGHNGRSAEAACAAASHRPRHAPRRNTRASRQPARRVHRPHRHRRLRVRDSDVERQRRRDRWPRGVPHRAGRPHAVSRCNRARGRDDVSRHAHDPRRVSVSNRRCERRRGRTRRNAIGEHTRHVRAVSASRRDNRSAFELRLTGNNRTVRGRVLLLLD